MQLNFTQIASAFMVLFAIIDILGSIPVLLGIQQKGIRLRPFLTSLVATIILMIFLFTGEGVLRLFNVDIHSFAAAGALIIFIFSIEMLTDVELFRNKGPEGASVIVPIAFPMVAGPGSFTTLLSLRAEYSMINIVIALVMNMLFVFTVLKITGKIERIIGQGGIYVLRKFFAIILLAIAVKLFTTNIGSLLS